MTADAGEFIDPEATRKLREDSYVDDNLSGGSPETVKRMKGEILADGKFNDTMQQILDLGSLKAKNLLLMLLILRVFSSQDVSDLSHLLGNL